MRTDSSGRDLDAGPAPRCAATTRFLPGCHLAAAPADVRQLGGGPPGCIGLGNGLTPSLTLGCGTYGRTSTTDNVTYTNLLNIKRVAHPLAGIGAPPPSGPKAEGRPG